MGMTTYIKAFIPDTDPEYLRHKKVFLACLAAEVSLPHETADYFDYFDGVPVDTSPLDSKLEFNIKTSDCLSRWKDDHGNAEGYEIDLTILPTGVTKIRFYNCW